MRRFAISCGFAALVFMAQPTIGVAQSAAAAPTVEQAVAQLRKGDLPEALRLLDAILADQPDDLSALFYASFTLVLQGKPALAEPRLEKLLKAAPSSFHGWELLVQATQATGNLERRDAAIGHLKVARRSALDPEIRRRQFFIRDRIVVGRRVFLVQDNLEAAGSAFTRYLAIAENEPGDPAHAIALRSDDETNEQWRENAALPLGKAVYHLDTLDRQLDGFVTSTPYEFYIDEPNYDRVRGKILEIMSGKAKPLAGETDPYWTALAR